MHRLHSRGILCVVIALGSCGGSSDRPDTPVAKISGTAAVGAPLSNTAVTLKCVAGSATGTTDANGRYEIGTPTSLQPPCMLKAASPNGDMVSASTSTSGTANITPLTHLLVAKLLAANPADAFSAFSPATGGRIAPESLSAAQGTVAAEILKIGASMPAANWISQPFTAAPGDAMDGALELLARKLAEHNKSMEGAAIELSTGPLYPARPLDNQDPECVPGLIAGFDGAIQDAITRVVRSREGLDPGGSGDAPGGTGGGAAGVGIGGSLGQFVNVDVTVHVADGPTFGPRRTDAAKGMVTFVPCSLQPPVHIRFEGKPGSGAKYYDEQRGELVSFENLSLEGVALRLDRNIGVTPFTDAVVQRARSLEDRQVAHGGFPLPKIVKAEQGWKDPARVQIAHDEVLRVVNDQLPGMYRLDDLTRLPVMLNPENDRSGSGVLTDNQNGLYGAVVGGFARSAAGNQIQAADAPAFRRAEQLSLDLSDGNLDQKQGDQVLWSSGSEAAYDVDQFWIESTRGTGRTSLESGDAELSSKQGIIFSSRGFEKMQGTRTTFHSTSGLLTFSEQCSWADGRIPGQEELHCKTEIVTIGRFAQVQASPNANLMAVSEDRKTLAIYNLRMDMTNPAGTVPPPLATLPVPVAEATTVALRSGLVLVSDGSVWRVAQARAEDGGFLQSYSLESVPMPPEVTRGQIGYFPPFSYTVPGDLAAPLGYGLTTAGDVVAWSLINPQSKKTLKLPVPAVQLSTDHHQVIARTQDGAVHWLNPEHATRWFQEGSTDVFVERPVHPPGQPPQAIAGVSNACWIAMPIVVDCAGGASKLIYEMSLHPNAFGYSGFDVIHGVEPIAGIRPIWRAVPAARFATGRESSVRSDATLIGVDGTLYAEDGSPQEVPAEALQ